MSDPVYVRELEDGIVQLKSQLMKAETDAKSANGRAALLAEVGAEVVHGIDQWNAAVQKIIGRCPDYHWGALESLRRLCGVDNPSPQRKETADGV